MKKMKGVVAMEPPPMYEDPRTRFKHQSLMQDYEELDKVLDLYEFSPISTFFSGFSQICLFCIVFMLVFVYGFSFSQIWGFS